MKKYPLSRLTSALHSFGTGICQSQNGKVGVFKKVKRGKITFQPGAVCRRKVKSGSRQAKVKGMTLKKNPFDLKTSVKRKHSLSAIVENNQPVAKKAGRHMSSKTRHFSVQKKDQKKVKKE